MGRKNSIRISILIVPVSVMLLGVFSEAVRAPLLLMLIIIPPGLLLVLGLRMIFIEPFSNPAPTIFELRPGGGRTPPLNVPGRFILGFFLFNAGLIPLGMISEAINRGEWVPYSGNVVDEGSAIVLFVSTYLACVVVSMLLTRWLLLDISKHSWRGRLSHTATIARPVGVTLVAILSFTVGAFALWQAVVMFVSAEVRGIYSALVAVLLLGGSHGLWALKPYGRILGLICAWFGLFAFPLGTIVSVVVLVYLYQPRIKTLISKN